MRQRDMGLAKLGVTLLFLTAFLPGCVMKDPLSNPDDAKLDERLIGAWKYQEGKFKDHTSILFIGKADVCGAPPGIMKTLSVDNDEKKQVRVSTEYFFPTFLGKGSYANFFDVSQLEGEKEKAWPKTPIREWWLTKYAVESDRLTVWLVDPNAAEKAITMSEVRGIVEEKGLLKIKSITFTDSKDLSRFLLDGGEKKLFSDEHKMVFSRIIN
jgi:hypothetical protein